MVFICTKISRLKLDTMQHELIPELSTTWLYCLYHQCDVTFILCESLFTCCKNGFTTEDHY